MAALRQPAAHKQQQPNPQAVGELWQSGRAARRPGGDEESRQDGRRRRGRGAKRARGAGWCGGPRRRATAMVCGGVAGLMLYSVALIAFYQRFADEGLQADHVRGRLGRAPLAAGLGGALLEEDEEEEQRRLRRRGVEVGASDPAPMLVPKVRIAADPENPEALDGGALPRFAATSVGRGAEESEPQEEDNVEVDASDSAWSWLDPEVEAFLAAEQAAVDVPFVAEQQQQQQQQQQEQEPQSSMVLDLMKSRLQRLKDQATWSGLSARGARRKAKEAVVVGTAQVMSRDLGAIGQAYEALGLSVTKASDLSAAVARGRLDANLRSVRGREWGVVLCLSLSTDKCLSLSDFERLETESGKGSRVNRVALLKEVLWSKDMYCKSAQWSSKWLAAFTFPCWVLPSDGPALLDKATRLEHETRLQHWIVKPYKQGGGKGISVLDDVRELRRLVRDDASGSGGKKVIVQPYLGNPHLLDGRKWDLRTYVLVTAVAPTARVYLFKDGLVRLASEAYDPGARHGGNKTQFLTNTSVNRRKVRDMDQLTWSFGRLESELGAERFRALFLRIKRAVGMLMVNAERAFAQRYAADVGAHFSCANCYHLLGVDLIVDSALQPRVIEVNGQPSMELSGAASSHYDSTKNAMQREVARVVLEPLPRLAEKLVADLRAAHLSKDDLQWLAEDSRAMVYLLRLRRELTKLESFDAVYPDPAACHSAARTALWKAFVDHVARDHGSDARVRLHRVLTRVVCAMQPDD